MAGGAAVVATDVGGTREIISTPDVGRLYPAGDVAALSAHLVELCRNASLREAIGRTAAAHVATHFSIPCMVTTIRATLVAAAAARAATHAKPHAIPPHGTRGVQRPDAPALDLFAARHEGRALQHQSFVTGPGTVWRVPGALAAFRTAARLECAGLEVVPHLAAAWRRNLLRGESILATGPVAGAEPAGPLLARTSPADRRRYAQAFAVWLAHLHAAGIAPRELKAADLLVVAADTPSPRFILPDFAHCRLSRLSGVTASTVARHFRQSFRSLQPWLIRRDVLRFLASYRRARNLPRARFRGLLARVEAGLHRRGTGCRNLR
jgi:hypothetical protein